MNFTKPMRVTALAASLALGLAACGGGGESGDGPGGGESPTGAPGGTYSAELTEPSYLAPASNCYETECSAVLDLVNDPLVSVDFESGELVFDGLAESIESEDLTTWTVTLKEGRTFHNGEPVDAEAFQRAWEYSSNPKNAQATAGFLSHIEGSGSKDLSGFEVVDDQTFEVTLGGAFSQFGHMMSYGPAFAPMAQACMDDLKACNEEPIGTGPYTMDGPWKHDQGITVTRWDEYAGDQPATADTIDFKMYTDGVAAFRDFQNGNLDVMNLSVAPEVYPEAKGQYGDEIIEEPTASLTYLGFPMAQAPFDDQLVRQAISLSIDRELIIEQVLNGLAYPSTDIVTPPIPGSRDDACEFCTYDPDRAKELLEESGVDPSGTTLQFYFNAGAGHDKWVEAAARQVQENLGFDYKLQSTEWAQYLELLDAREFTGPFRLGWSLDYPSPENYIRPIVGSNGDSNYTGYSNEEVDAKLVEGDQQESVDDAIASYQAAGDLALEELPIIPLWSGASSVIHSDNIGDVRFDVGEGEIAFKEISVTQ
jgi:ABC-type oligopeptide transport system substrate-binding subunit